MGRPYTLTLNILICCCVIGSVIATAVPTLSPTVTPPNTTGTPTTPAPTIMVMNTPNSPLCTSTRQFTRHHFTIFLGGNPCTNDADIARVSGLLMSAAISTSQRATLTAELARLTALPDFWLANAGQIIESGECCSIFTTNPDPRLYEFCWDGENVKLNLTTQTGGNILADGTSYIKETCFVGTGCDADCYELDFAQNVGERISVRVVGWTFKFDFDTQASLAMSIVLIVLIVGILLLGIYFLIFAILSKNDR